MNKTDPDGLESEDFITSESPYGFGPGVANLVNMGVAMTKPGGHTGQWMTQPHSHKENALAAAALLLMVYMARPRLGKPLPEGYKPYVPHETLPNGTTKPLPLPKNAQNEVMPISKAPHSTLGTKLKPKTKGEQPYPQAVEWGENGVPKRRIDFSNHRRADHFSPHSHDAVHGNGTSPQFEHGNPKIVRFQ